MGMFDYYRPVPPISCPSCGTPLNEWQGKDGPTALFVWEQGKAAPVDQAVGESMKCEDPGDWVLPARFIIYAYCESCRRLVEAVGYSDNEIWTRTELHSPDNAWRRDDESRSEFARRIEEMRRQQRRGAFTRDSSTGG
jgi:hypothetical protein